MQLRARALSLQPPVQGPCSWPSCETATLPQPGQICLGMKGQNSSGKAPGLTLPNLDILQVPRGAELRYLGSWLVPRAAMQLLRPSPQETGSCKATSIFSRALTHPDAPSLAFAAVFPGARRILRTSRVGAFKNQRRKPSHPSPTPTPPIHQQIPFIKPHPP